MERYEAVLFLPVFIVGGDNICCVIFGVEICVIMAPVKHYTEQTFPVEISKISANTDSSPGQGKYINIGQYLPLFSLHTISYSQTLNQINPVNPSIFRKGQKSN